MAAVEQCIELPIAEIAAHAAEVDREARFPREGLAALRQCGALALGVPEAFGGPGGGPVEIARAIRQVGGACGSTSMVFAMHLIATQTLLADAGDADGPKAATLRAIAAGDHLTTLAYSERGSRSHFWAQPTHARRVDAGVAIDAHKTWVTSAAEALSYIVATGAPDTAQSLATELYLVDATTEGIEIQGRFDGLGMCGNGSSPVTFTNVVVADDRRIGPAAGGYATMMAATFPWFVLGCSSCCVGLAGEALRLACEHAGAARLEHSGETLSDLPVIRARLAEARIRHAQAEALVDRVAVGLEAGAPDQIELLAVKASAAEMAIDVTDAAMRACGGAAYSRQLPVERLFRDARAAAIMAPTTDVLRDLIGNALCGRQG